MRCVVLCCAVFCSVETIHTSFRYTDSASRIEALSQQQPQHLIRLELRSFVAVVPSTTNRSYVQPPRVVVNQADGFTDVHFPTV